jgi:hypothetical protein
LGASFHTFFTDCISSRPIKDLIVANHDVVDTPMLQSALGKVKQVFAHIQEPSWMEWGSLILALPPQYVANDHKSQDWVQKEAKLLMKLIDGAISQSEYEQQIGEFWEGCSW